MKKIPLHEVRETEWKSPSGKFHTFGRELSIAHGREPKSTDLMKRQPFDVMIARLPAGAIMCPYHFHSQQWEFYIVLTGRAEVRDAGGTTTVEPGDTFLFKPGEAHQIRNPGPEELTFYVIADNPVGEWCHYPDSGKWMAIGSARTVIKGSETHYLDGEE